MDTTALGLSPGQQFDAGDMKSSLRDVRDVDFEQELSEHSSEQSEQSSADDDDEQANGSPSASLEERQLQTDLRILAAIARKQAGERYWRITFSRELAIDEAVIIDTLRRHGLERCIGDGVEFNFCMQDKVADVVRQLSGDTDVDWGSVERFGRWLAIKRITGRRTHIKSGLVEARVRLSNRSDEPWVKSTDLDDVALSRLFDMTDFVAKPPPKQTRRASVRARVIRTDEQRLRRDIETDEQKAARLAQRRKARAARQYKKSTVHALSSSVQGGDQRTFDERFGMIQLLWEQDEKASEPLRSAFPQMASNASVLNAYKQFASKMNCDTVNWCACCSEWCDKYKRYSLDPDSLGADPNSPGTQCRLISPQLVKHMHTHLQNDYGRPLQHARNRNKAGLQRLDGMVLSWRRYANAASADEELEAGINEDQQTLVLCDRCHGALRRKRRPARALANRLLYSPVDPVFYDATDIELTVSSCGRRCVKVLHLEAYDKRMGRDLPKTRRPDEYPTFRGNFISFPQDPLSVGYYMTKWPMAPADLSETVFVTLANAGFQLKTIVPMNNVLGVRRSKVQAILERNLRNDCFRQVTGGARACVERCYGSCGRPPLDARYLTWRFVKRIYACTPTATPPPSRLCLKPRS
jgi:hypothetical protein